MVRAIGLSGKVMVAKTLSEKQSTDGWQQPWHSATHSCNTAGWSFCVNSPNLCSTASCKPMSFCVFTLTFMSTAMSAKPAAAAVVIASTVPGSLRWTCVSRSCGRVYTSTLSSKPSCCRRSSTGFTKWRWYTDRAGKTAPEWNWSHWRGITEDYGNDWVISRRQKRGILRLHHKRCSGSPFQDTKGEYRHTR